MERPSKIRQCINGELIDTYRTADIDPLLDELEALRGAGEFPTENEFSDFMKLHYKFFVGYEQYIYNYFRNRVRTIESMPEVGKEYEGLRASADEWVKGKLNFLNIGGTVCRAIRPIQPPTRESIIEKARQVLSEEEINILTGV